MSSKWSERELQNVIALVLASCSLIGTVGETLEALDAPLQQALAAAAATATADSDSQFAAFIAQLQAACILINRCGEACRSLDPATATQLCRAAKLVFGSGRLCLSRFIDTAWSGEMTNLVGYELAAVGQCATLFKCAVLQPPGLDAQQLKAACAALPGVPALRWVATAAVAIRHAPGEAALTVSVTACEGEGVANRPMLLTVLQAICRLCLSRHYGMWQPASVRCCPSAAALMIRRQLL